VVIAIIGVLSSVVLSSLNSARGKGNDAKVKAQLSSARGAAEIYYSNQTPPSYLSMCGAASTDPSGIYQYLLAANYPDNQHVNCGISNTGYQAYALWHELPFAGGYFCVDSTGNAQSYPGPAPADGTMSVCP
jgi:type II secretory pathway pseudopilin PulG